MGTAAADWGQALTPPAPRYTIHYSTKNSLNEIHAPQEVATALGRQVFKGGKVIWRSAALTPPYAALVAKAGFEVRGSLADPGFDGT